MLQSACIFACGFVFDMTVLLTVLVTYEDPCGSLEDGTQTHPARPGRVWSGILGG